MRSWTPPTPEDITKATVALARPEYHRYFFDRLQNPLWVEPLRVEGWFKGPPEPVDEGQSRRYPPWPQSAYLVRMAKYPEAHAALARVLEKIDERGHVYVRADLIDVAIQLPAAEAAPLAKRAARWARGVGSWVVVRRLPDFFVALAKGGENKAALKVLRALVEPLPDPESKRGLKWFRTGSGLEGWQFSEMLEKELLDVAPGLGVPLIDELARALDMGLDRGDSPEEVYSDASKVWRPKISSPRDRNEMLDVLVTAIDRVADILLRHGAATFDQIADTLASRPRLVFDRLLMNLLLRHPELPLPKRLLESRSLFFDFFPFEYRTLLRERVGSTEATSRAVLRSYVEEEPDVDQWVRNVAAFWGEAEPGLGDHLRNEWRAQRLWALESDPDMPEAWRTELRELISKGFAVVEPDKPKSGFRFGRASPVPPEELESKSPEEIAGLFESTASSTDPLEPSVEGLGQVSSRQVAQNPETFAQAVDLSRRAGLTYISVVFSGLREAFGAGRSFDWDSLVEQCAIVLERLSELPPQDTPVELVPSRETVVELKHSICHLLWDGLQRGAPFSEATMDLAWETLGRLCEEKEPTDQDERSLKESEGDAFTMSLNATRAIAMNGVMAFAIRRWREAGAAWKDLDSVPGLREILDRHLAKDPSLAVRSVYGKWFPWLVAMDPEWAQHAAPRVFTEGASFSAAWNAYVVYNEPYNNVLAAARPAYERAVETLSTTGPEASLRPDDVRSSLGKHILAFYVRGLVQLDAGDDLWARFVAASSPALLRRSLEDLGRYLGPKEMPLEAEVTSRLVSLWESRVQAVRERPVEEREEMQAFAEWFESGHFEPRWLLEKLQEAVTLAESSASATAGSKVLERLAELAPGNPAECVKCLRTLVDHDKDGWVLFGTEDEVRNVLRTALAAGGTATEEATDLIHRLGEKGFYQFRDLLASRQTGSE